MPSIDSALGRGTLLPRLWPILEASNSTGLKTLVGAPAMTSLIIMLYHHIGSSLPSAPVYICSFVSWRIYMYHSASDRSSRCLRRQYAALCTWSRWLQRRIGGTPRATWS